MKLQSMTDYVLEQRNNKDTDNIRRFWACERYAHFLKQPLTLGMFIPTDENGNVFEEDGTDGDGYVLDKIMHDEFQQAKDRVIFEGFSERIFETIKDNRIQYIGCDKFEYCYRDVGSNIWIASNNKLKTIEDLVKYNLTIRETAVKKYGL